MKKKLIGLLLAAVMAVSALPASANTGGNDVGVFTGNAVVSKNGACANDGSATGQSGGGIGLPVPGDYKKAIFSIVSPAFTVGPPPAGVLSLLRGAGSLRLCGHLTGPADRVVEGVEQDQLGASCVATKGYGGQGEAIFPATNELVYVRNLGWKATVGGTFVVTADSSINDKSKKTDGLVAVVQALSEGAIVGCLTKVTQTAPEIGTGKAGTQNFTVVAYYYIIGGGGGIGNKKDKED